MYVHPMPAVLSPQYVQEAGAFASMILSHLKFRKNGDLLVAHTRLRHAIIGMVMELKAQ